MPGGQDDPSDPEFEGFYGPCGAIRPTSFEIELASLPRKKEMLNNNDNGGVHLTTTRRRDIGNDNNGDIPHIQSCFFTYNNNDPFISWCEFFFFMLSLAALGYIIVIAVATTTSQEPPASLSATAEAAVP